MAAKRKRSRDRPDEMTGKVEPTTGGRKKTISEKREHDGSEARGVGRKGLGRDQKFHARSENDLRAGLSLKKKRAISGLQAQEGLGLKIHVQMRLHSHPETTPEQYQ